MRHSDPLLPGSFTPVASNARTWKPPAADTAKPCSQDNSAHSACSQAFDFLGRLSRATSDNSARSAFLARTTVSRREYPHARCIKRVRSDLSTDLSFRSPFSAPVSSARSAHLSVRNDTSRSRFSLVLDGPSASRMATATQKSQLENQVGAYDTFFQKLVRASATIDIRQRSIEVRFRPRANNPFPLAANYVRMRPAIPWPADCTHPQIPLSLPNPHMLYESGNLGQGIIGAADGCAVPGSSDEIVQAPDSL